MRSYTEYNLEDFLQDSQFQRWAKNPSPQDEAFWNQWLLEHPGKREIVEQARLLLQSIDRMQHVAIGEEEVQRSIQQILSRAGAPSDREDNQKTGWTTLGSNWLRVAAAVSILIGIAWWLAVSREKTGIPAPISQVATQLPEQPLVRVNNTAAPFVVNLPDGSTIILQNNSRVSYPAVFSKNSREVYLTGEAFFEIRKNPESPFYVHAQEVVTKVLGTSFYVKADSIHRRVTVSVKTGKVSVYSISAQETLASVLKGAPDAVLSPNQQSVYEPAHEKQVKAVWHVTDVITQPIPDTHFTFDSTPVPQVFAALEKAYGIAIAYNQESLKNCSITATLTDEPLATKLDLICKSIGLSYQMKNAEVEISGKGCLQ